MYRTFSIAISIWVGLLLIVPINQGHAQELPFTLQQSVEQEINVQELFFKSDTIFPFTSDRTIGGLSVSGEIHLKSDSSYVRLILVDSQLNEHLVFESYTMLLGSQHAKIEQWAEETATLNNVIPSYIAVEVFEGTLFLEQIQICKADPQIQMAKGNLMRKQMLARISKLNQNLEDRNIPWTAGETSFAYKSYEEKKAYFGGQLPNLQGFEYYSGGIFIMPGAESSQSNGSESAFAPGFDWRDRHGQNWMTPVKDQGWCGSCWAFGAAGATEHLVNIYYNQKLDLDLSEQYLLSCSETGSCRGGWTYRTVDFIRETGIVEEDCFPYKALDLPCSEQCDIPGDVIRIDGYQNHLERTEENFKDIVLSGASTFSIMPWRHSITLAGYKTIHAGDRFYIKSSQESRWVTIDPSSEWIGSTAWLIKNSWGTGWGESGFAYIITNTYDINPWHTCRLFGPVNSQILGSSDIACTDSDGDGYYYWGIGPKPAHCPPSPDEPDGDDSNPCFGPSDPYGNLLAQTPGPIVEEINVFQDETIPNLTATGNNLKWYSDYAGTQLVYSGASFPTGHTEPGDYIYYVSQTMDDCESPVEMARLNIHRKVDPPEVEHAEVCQGHPVEMCATGTKIRWYEDPELTQLLYQGNCIIPSSSDAGLITLYVTQTVVQTESPYTTVELLVKPAPKPALVEDKTFCEGDSIFMHADGENISWYLPLLHLHFKDPRDNRYYNIVKIGKQVWMTSNLNIGEMIEGSIEQTDNGVIEKYSYSNDSVLGKKYGGLYQWGELMAYSQEVGSQGVCPDGWHIPSHEEWKELEVFVGMDELEADKLGLRGTDEGAYLQDHYKGIYARLGGKRKPDGGFENLEGYGTYWTSDQYTRTFSDYFDQIYASASDAPDNGFSVRCVADDTLYVKKGNRLDVTGYPFGRDHVFNVTNSYEGCESVPETARLRIYPKPTPPYLAEPDVNACNSDLPLTFTIPGNIPNYDITWYGDVSAEAIVDERDGQEYQTVKIGRQLWMAENLNVGIQVDGAVEQTNNQVIEKYVYNNDPDMGVKYGGLYQWDELMDYSDEENSQGICPAGWRLPSDRDWQKLEVALGMNVAEATLYEWRGNQGEQILAGGSSGFAALMGGKRTPEGTFKSEGSYGTYWNSSGLNRTLTSGENHHQIYRSKFDDPSNAFSVRCIMDESLYTSETEVWIDNPLSDFYSWEVINSWLGCESDPTAVTLTLSENPLPPVTANIIVCENEDIPPLVAEGENIHWIRDEWYDYQEHFGNSFDTKMTKPGLYEYRVSQRIGACKSPERWVSLDIEPAPEGPMVRDTFICEGDSLLEISIDGPEIRWYADPELTTHLHSGNKYSPGKTIPGIHNFYVTQRSELNPPLFPNTCESHPSQLILETMAKPDPPEVRDTTYCGDESDPVALAYGEQIQWYETADLSVPVFSGNKFKTGIRDTGTYYFYATQTINACTGYPALNTISLNSIPAAPTATQIEICENDRIPVLKAVGKNIRWYKDIIATKYLIPGDSILPDLDSAGKIYYFPTQTIDECESLPAIASLTIKSPPPPPGITDITLCEGEEIPSLRAIGEKLNWYQDPTRSILFYSGDQFHPGLKEVGVYHYYVSQTIADCESLAAHTKLIINAMPKVELGRDTAILVDQVLILGPYSTRYQYLWSNNSVDPYLIVDGDIFGLGDHEILVRVTHKGCEIKDSIVISIAAANSLDSEDLEGVIKVYPNPAEDVLFIESENPDKQLVSLTSAGGAILYMKEMTGTLVNINLSGIPPGVFFLSIRSGEYAKNIKIVKL